MLGSPAKAISGTVLLLLVAAPVAAQEFLIYPDADEWDSPATAFNGQQNKWLVLAHEADWISMRRTGWQDAIGPWVADPATLDEAYATSYAIAYDWESDSYLAVWTTGYEVLAARVDYRGQRIDDPFTLYSSASEILEVDVVYVAERQRWLALWQKYESGGPHPVLMRLVNSDGTLEGSVFDIGVATLGGWSVDYSPRDEQFLLVWGGVSGQFFLENGDTVGGVLDVGSGSDPAVVWGHKARRWLIVWQDSYWDGWDVLNLLESRLVIEGVLQPIVVLWQRHLWDYHEFSPAVAYNPVLRKFLVTWIEWGESYGWRPVAVSHDRPFRQSGFGEPQPFQELYGQWVREAGDPYRGTFRVAGDWDSWLENRNEEYVACSTLEPRCLVTWSEPDYWDEWDEDGQIGGRFITDLRKLTVTKSGTGTGGVQTDPAGICIYCDEDEELFLIDTLVTLTATPHGDSEFTGWSGHPDCLDGVVTMSEDKTCTAGFAYKPLLTVTRTGSGGGTVTSSPGGIDCGFDCEERYSLGTVVQLTATPAGGSSFGGWSGHADCLDGRVTMSADRTCTASFVPMWTLSVSRSGSGSGTVTSMPPGVDCGADCAEDYAEGTIVALHATPDMGSELAGWSGDPDCADGSVTMDADVACEAVFGPCSIPSEVTLTGMTIDTQETYEACNVLIVGPSVLVTGNGDAEFRAGNAVEFVPPVTIDDGCGMRVLVPPPPP